MYLPFIQYSFKLHTVADVWNIHPTFLHLAKSYLSFRIQPNIHNLFFTEIYGHFFFCVYLAFCSDHSLRIFYTECNYFFINQPLSKKMNLTSNYQLLYSKYGAFKHVIEFNSLKMSKVGYLKTIFA